MNNYPSEGTVLSKQPPDQNRFPGLTRVCICVHTEDVNLILYQLMLTHKTNINKCYRRVKVKIWNGRFCPLFNMT